MFYFARARNDRTVRDLAGVEEKEWMFRVRREVPLNLSGPDNNGLDETDEFRANISGHYRWRVRFAVRGKCQTKPGIGSGSCFRRFRIARKNGLQPKEYRLCSSFSSIRTLIEVEGVKRGCFSIDKNVFTLETTNLAV